MTVDYARDLWLRAVNALKSAETLLSVSPDDAASRCYYAAFDAVSALFALQGRTFTKHTAVRASVHRDLIQTGIWPEELGEAFDAVWELRDIGDYGGETHAQPEDVAQAIQSVREIHAAVLKMCPQLQAEETDNEP